MNCANLEDDILPSKRHHNINILLVMQNCDNPETYITFISNEGALRLLITIPSHPSIPTYSCEDDLSIEHII